MQEFFKIGALYCLHEDPEPTNRLRFFVSMFPQEPSFPTFFFKHDYKEMTKNFIGDDLKRPILKIFNGTSQTDPRRPKPGDIVMYLGKTKFGTGKWLFGTTILYSSTHLSENERNGYYLKIFFELISGRK